MEKIEFELYGRKCYIDFVEDSQWKGMFHVQIEVKGEGVHLLYVQTDGFDPPETCKVPGWAVKMACDMAENPENYYD